MNRQAIRLLHLRELRRHPLRTALTVVAVGAGVALVVGVAISMSSLHQSIDSFTGRLGGRAELRVEGPVDHGGLDASVLPAVERVPGVQAAVPMVITVTQAVDERGRDLLIPALGVDCSIERAMGAFGCTPDLLRSLDGGPAVGPALRSRLGAGGAIRTDLGTDPVRTAPVVQALRGVNGGLVALYELESAQREFVRPEGLDAIFVVPTPGSDLARLRTAVAAAVGPSNKVLDANAPVTGSEVASILLPFLLLISAIGLLIGAQLVGKAVELALEERRRELATAAALGASPRRLVGGVLAEGAVVGVVGGAVGVGLGWFVASVFVGSLSDQIERSTGLRVPVVLSAADVALGLGVGIVVCLAASILPARRASQRELAVELSERGRYAPTLPRGRVPVWLPLVGLVACLAAAWPAHLDGAIERWQPPVLWSAMLVATALVFRLPAHLVGRVLALLRGRGPFGTGPTRLALDNLLSTPKRTASMAAAIAAPVVMAVMIGNIVPSIRIGAGRVAEQSSSGRVYASTLGAITTGGIDAKPTPDLEARISAVPGVARIEHWYYAVVSHPDTKVAEVDGIDGAIPRYTVYEGLDGPTAIARGMVMIGPSLARDEGLRRGSTIVVPGRYGPVRLTVGGVWADTNGVGRGIVTTAEVLRTITGPRPPDRLVIVPTPEVDPVTLAERIRSQVDDPRLVVKDPTELTDYLADEFADVTSPFWAMQRGILFVALIATASTLLLVAIQRRRELAVLAALGTSPADLARSTLVETLLLGTTAAVIAVVGAQVSLAIFTWASGLMTSLVIPYSVQPGGAVVAALSAIGIALLGAALPAWRANRADPILALREA